MAIRDLLRKRKGGKIPPPREKPIKSPEDDDEDDGFITVHTEAGDEMGFWNKIAKQGRDSFLTAKDQDAMEKRGRDVREDKETEQAESD